MITSITGRFKTINIVTSKIMALASNPKSILLGMKLISQLITPTHSSCARGIFILKQAKK
jgi:threonine/homoserine/homoserine lactone efflux protein